MTGYSDIPDISKRLRAANRITAGWSGEDIIDPLLHEAADEIERLRGLLREVVAKRRTILPLDLIDRIDTAMAANWGDSGNG